MGNGYKKRASKINPYFSKVSVNVISKVFATSSSTKTLSQSFSDFNDFYVRQKEGRKSNDFNQAGLKFAQSVGIYSQKRQFAIMNCKK